MLNNQGRPTRSGDGSASQAATFTGNRALDMEEALIFETGRLEATGVDIDEPAPFVSRLGAHARQREIGLPGLTEPEALRHYVRLSQQELFDRCRPLSARLLHDEAQSAPQRENGAPAGLCRHSSAAADIDRARRAGADRRTRANAADADRHERNRDVAESRRAWRTLRHDGDQGGDRGARRRGDPQCRARSRIRRMAPIRRPPR